MHALLQCQEFGLAGPKLLVQGHLPRQLPLLLGLPAQLQQFGLQLAALLQGRVTLCSLGAGQAGLERARLSGDVQRIHGVQPALVQRVQVGLRLAGQCQG